jgi:hypothetical protein
VAEQRCKNWLKSEMEANQEPPKRSNEYLAEAKQKFNVGPRPFRRAWRAAIQETGRNNWQNAGRPKKS